VNQPLTEEYVTELSLEMYEAPSIGGIELACPRCNEVDVHHQDVIVNARPTEDGSGRQIRVGTNGIATARFLRSEEFVGRRADVRILFYCEHCCGPDRYFWVLLAQHKGKTLLSTYFDEESTAQGVAEEAEERATL
jgi:hypothetical protein